MPTKRQLGAMNIYANLMVEVKIRMTSIETACSGQTGLPGPLVREFCFLQLRMICELIALGCLTAHGDIKATQSGKLAKEYSADRILMLLGNLHPDFYPRPSRHTQLGSHGHHFEAIKDGFMTKADLSQLYQRCGGILHRGSIKKLLAGKMAFQTNFPEIIRLTQKIHNLLQIHQVMLLGGGTVFVCTLYQKDTGNVQVAIAEADE